MDTHAYAVFMHKKKGRKNTRESAMAKRQVVQAYSQRCEYDSRINRNIHNMYMYPYTTKINRKYLP